MADGNTYSLRSRTVKMAASDTNETYNGIPGTTGGSRSKSSSSSAATPRTIPHLPTPLESLVLLVYPALLIFGTLFSALSPETRSAPYDAAGQSHVQTGVLPSYFARKNNLFNTLFVKRGWGWVTGAFVLFVLTHPALASSSAAGARRKARAGIRWALVTGWWVLVTQWCFGPALIDRGFRWSGGKCEVAQAAVFEGTGDAGDVFTATACKATGGRWAGGHDISGHVFLLVLGSFFLLQEVGWAVARAGAIGPREERCVVMADGAVKGAGVEADRDARGSDASDAAGLGLSGRFAFVVVGLSWWMLLMTAIYFHTWFEKTTGFLTALLGIYPVYYLPRWIPALRDIIGLPGI